MEGRRIPLGSSQCAGHLGGRPTVDRAGFRIAQPNDDGVVIRLVVMSGQGGLQISVGHRRAAAVGRGAGHRGRRAAGASRRRRVTVASPEILARWPFLPRRRRPVRAARRSPHPDSAPAPRRVTRSSYMNSRAAIMAARLRDSVNWVHFIQHRQRSGHAEQRRTAHRVASFAFARRGLGVRFPSSGQTSWLSGILSLSAEAVVRAGLRARPAGPCPLRHRPACRLDRFTEPIGDL